eukprot:83409-Chlamydomonas_euryale.AAC.3
MGCCTGLHGMLHRVATTAVVPGTLHPSTGPYVRSLASSRAPPTTPPTRATFAQPLLIDSSGSNGGGGSGGGRRRGGPLSLELN